MRQTGQFSLCILGVAEFQEKLQLLEDFVGSWSNNSDFQSSSPSGMAFLSTSVSVSSVPELEPQIVSDNPVVVSSGSVVRTIDVDSNIVEFPELPDPALAFQQVSESEQSPSLLLLAGCLLVTSRVPRLLVWLSCLPQFQFHLFLN